MHRTFLHIALHVTQIIEALSFDTLPFEGEDLW